MFRERSLVSGLLPATSTLGFCSTCLFLQENSPGMYCAMWEGMINCMSIFQASACVTFSDTILPKANYIAYPRVRVEYLTKLHGKGRGYAEGEELESFLKSITYIYTMSHQRHRFLTTSPTPNIHTSWHTENYMAYWGKRISLLLGEVTGYPRAKGLNI